MGVLRNAKVAVRVLDLEEALVHYRDYVGLYEVAREPGRVYLKAWDEYDHHSVILEEADRAGMDHVGFKVRFENDLDEVEKRCRDFGLSTKRVAAGARIGEGETLCTTLPSGHKIEFFHQMERTGIKVGSTNPQPWPDDLHGMGATRYDHVLLTCDDVEEATRFFVEVLDFHQSERMLAPDTGEMLASFLHVTNKAHDIAFIKGPDSKLHHLAFALSSWDDVLRAADIQARYDISTELTPSRHGLTRGLTTYFFDPSGNRNETYCGGTFPYYDDEVVTWTADQAPKAIFYHGREMIQSFGEAVT